MNIDIDAHYHLAPGVALRREGFGGLVYRHDNRRLYFLHSHELVKFIGGLDGARPLRRALDDFLLSSTHAHNTRESLLNAVGQLEGLGLLEHETSETS